MEMIEVGVAIFAFQPRLTVDFASNACGITRAWCVGPYDAQMAEAAASARAELP
jgi:hypothetical protein